MNRIFTLLIAVLSVFSIVSCDRSSDDNKPQEEQKIIEVPFTDELKGVYKIHYKDTPSGWEAVPANKYKLEFREGNTVYWTDENRYPYADKNKKGYLFYVWDKKPLKDGEYYQITMTKGTHSVFNYYCTKQ